MATCVSVWVGVAPLMTKSLRAAEIKAHEKELFRVLDRASTSGNIQLIDTQNVPTAVEGSDIVMLWVREERLIPYKDEPNPPAAVPELVALPAEPTLVQRKRRKPPAAVKQLNVAVGDGPVYKERLYSITELVRLWAPISRGTISKAVKKHLSDLVKISNGTGLRTRYFVPESALQCIYTELTN